MMDLLDAVKIHLRINHFPIVLILVGTLAAVAAAILRREGIWRYALVTVLVAGIAAPVVAWTGYRAEDQADEYENIESGRMEEHEESALLATYALVAAAIAAAVALAPAPGSRAANVLRYVALVLAVVASGLTLKTSYEGGRIVHNWATEGWPGPRPAYDQDEPDDAPNAEQGRGGDDDDEEEDR